MRKFFLLFICVLITFGISAQQTNKKGLPIGVFDSGTGGLTVLEAMLTLDAFNNVTGKPGADGKPDFDKEYFQYLADQANMPYGNYAAENKTDLLKEHVVKNMDFLYNNKYDKIQNELNAEHKSSCITNTALLSTPLTNLIFPPYLEKS